MLTRTPSGSVAWARTRELFTDWTARCSRCDTQTSRALMDVQWRSLSVWWMTNLVTKDTSVEADWFVKLHRRLAMLPADTSLRPARRPAALMLLRQCLADMLRWLLVRAAFSAVDYPAVGVWFLVIGYNLTRQSSGLIVDRNFATAPELDTAHGTTAGYLVWFMPSLPRFFDIGGWRARMRSLLSDTRRNCIVADAHLSLADVISCHFTAARALLKFRKWRRTSGAIELAKIDGIDCSDIVYDELEASFLGNMQQTMQYASAVASVLAATRSRPLVVSYGEMLGPMRAIYHQGRRANRATVFVTVQHAMECENKLGAYHRACEFAHAGEPEGRQFSPAPDLFLVQGAQYRTVLQSFFPADRIGTIGSLKYDAWPERINARLRIAAGVRERLGVGSRRLMVVAPSVNDDVEICGLLRGLAGAPGWLVVALPHPAVSIASLQRSLGAFGLTQLVSIPDGVTMAELITAADLVVCGISTVAIEAAAFAVPAVRAVRDDVFPQFPDEAMIPCFSEPSDFARWLAEDFPHHCATRTAADYEALVRRYFYALDGMAADRLWQRLDPLLTAGRS